jgi:hypothetical protein
MVMQGRSQRTIDLLCSALEIQAASRWNASNAIGRRAPVGYKVTEFHHYRRQRLGNGDRRQRVFQPQQQRRPVANAVADRK